MKFKKEHPKFGDTRIIKRFLWFPMIIHVRPDNGRSYTETRWLETVFIKQEFTHSHMYKFWANIGFVEKED